VQSVLELTDIRATGQGNDALAARLLESLHSSRSAECLTHSFYRYPASMSPYLAREAVEQFTKPGEVVLDPFVGGGTTVVEAIAAGRQAIGIDLNPIATFVTEAKTTPLSVQDAHTLRVWLRCLDLTSRAAISGLDPEPRTKNLPADTSHVLARIMDAVAMLPKPRQRRFIRCALLRLGQWAVDCRSAFPDGPMMKERLTGYAEEMIVGLDDLTLAARSQGVAKNRLTGQRILLQRSAAGVGDASQLRMFRGRARLVLTSPPYPGVHVLYHRWQVNGRRETPAPYWLIDQQDGHGSAYYTLGSRTPFGLNNYFETITSVFSSLRSLLQPSALVVQLISFSAVESQLPAYLRAMERAGYEEAAPIAVERPALWRCVPNRRRWYNHIDSSHGAAYELLLFHRQSRGVDS
jgi:hypothetical protein